MAIQKAGFDSQDGEPERSSQGRVCTKACRGERKASGEKGLKSVRLDEKMMHTYIQREHK